MTWRQLAHDAAIRCEASYFDASARGIREAHTAVQAEWELDLARDEALIVKKWFERVHVKQPIVVPSTAHAILSELAETIRILEEALAVVKREAAREERATVTTTEGP